MEELCRRSRCGLAITGRVGRHHTFFCAEGRVLSSFLGTVDPVTRQVDLDAVKIGAVQPWSEMSVEQLNSIKKAQWRPYRSKNILEIIASKL